MMRCRVEYWGAGLVLIVAWLTVMYIAYQLFYPFDPAEVKSFTVYPTVIKQGSYLNYTLEYCKYMELSGKVMRDFENDIVYAIPDTYSDVPLGCRVAYNQIKVPDELPPGTYRIGRTGVYRVSALRDVEVRSVSNNFEVVKSDSSG